MACFDRRRLHGVSTSRPRRRRDPPPRKDLHGGTRQPRRHAHNNHATSHAATTLFGVFAALPAAFALHAKLTAKCHHLAVPYWVRLPVSTLALMLFIVAGCVVQFQLGRAPCRAVLGYGCLKA